MDSTAGVGIDLGTMNIVAARRIGNEVQTKRVRNAFIDLPKEHKRMLTLAKTSYAEMDGRLVVVGDAALETANLLNKDVRRPMFGGIMSAGELDAQQIIALIMKEVLGAPIVKNEKCCYSVPAVAMDVHGSDVTYHSAILKKVLTELGYSPEPINEAMAIIYSECVKENFSAIAISYGCLTPDTTIFTRNGLEPISKVREGDLVLTKEGEYSKVSKIWSKHYDGCVYNILFHGNPLGVTLTGNHKVYVNRNAKWDWIPTEQLVVGDIIGEPNIKYVKGCPILSINEKLGNGKRKPRVLNWSNSLCRFLGYFLADGHIGPDDRGGIFVDFGPSEQEFADDFKKLIAKLFKRSVSFIKHGNAIRCGFSHNSLRSWLKNHCYETVDGKKVKIFPLKIEELNYSSVLGLIVGLVRGDGWTIKYKKQSFVKFGNSSKSLVTAFHLLIGRIGLTSTITRRTRTKDIIWKDGRRILKENLKPEWIVNVTGSDGLYLYNLVENFNENGLNRKVWNDGGFRCTKILKIKKESYSGNVHDITVDGDPSFSAPYITLHNSGMTNVCLAFNAMPALEFSVGRGGDWIDSGAAKAVGTTTARICSIKENEIDISTTLGTDNRESEAIILFIQTLIDYTIDKIIESFAKKKGEIHISKPIPIIISGGTSCAKGFLPKFKERFETYKSKFPVQISEIRAAVNPMTSVANGLLLLAQTSDE